MNPTELEIEMMRQWESAPAIAAEITRTKAINAELVEALEEIAQYDKDSKHGPGICPYGCDCPHIARAAIERARG